MQNTLVGADSSFHKIGLDLCHFSLDAHSTLGVGELDVADPRLLLRVGVDNVTEMLGLLADGLGVFAGLPGGGSADSGMDLLVKSLELSATESLLPLGELLVETLLVVGLEVIVIALHVATEDVRGVLLGVERSLGLLGLDGLSALGGDKLGLGDVEAGESLLLVGDVEAAIGRTLHGAENAVAGGGADETDVEVGLEGALVVVDLAVVHGVDGAVDLGVSLVEVGETLVGEQSAGAEETSAVGGSVVGEAGGESEASELGGVSGGDDTISLDADVDNLGDYTLVSATDAETVLPGVVLVLLLVH